MDHRLADVNNVQGQGSLVVELVSSVAKNVRSGKEGFVTFELMSERVHTQCRWKHGHMYKYTLYTCKEILASCTTIHVHVGGLAPARPIMHV
jgi:hypothetical protein